MNEIIRNEVTDEEINKLSNLYLIANRMTYRTQKVRDAARDSFRKGMKAMRDMNKIKVSELNKQKNERL